MVPLTRTVVVVFFCAALPLLNAGPAQAQPTPTGHGAIFFHPDGTSAAHWDATRLRYVGPDSLLHWDRLPAVAPYRGHLSDQLTGTSNAGAVAHATGTRPHSETFGLDPSGQEYRSANGTRRTVMESAINAGLKTALVQTGSLIEPGTAAFVAEAPRRAAYEEIAFEVVTSGVDVILGGGEKWLLPEGTQGRFGEGARTDGRNLIRRLKENGYTIVYTRKELMNVPPGTTKVFGVFASGHTFRDRTEEQLRAAGLSLYVESAPTIAEMTSFALNRIARGDGGFFAVIEEEGSDNICNQMNASGCLRAMKRADETIGELRRFLDANPETFVLTTSDSNANGMQLVSVEGGTAVPAFDPGSGAPMDGVRGSGTDPFRSAPDADGRRFPFAIGWAHDGDVGSGVLARAGGLKAQEKVPATGLSNIDVYRALYETLFGDASLSENNGAAEPTQGSSR
ncbi:MAG: alkaline phosphatase [Salinibacter sp.]